MKIQVQQKHITAGEMGSPHQCAIALAIEEQLSKEFKKLASKFPKALKNVVPLPELQSVNVTETDIEVQIAGETRVMMCSDKVAKFIEAFDEGCEEPKLADYEFSENPHEEWKAAHDEWKKKQKLVKPFAFELKLS